MLNLEALTSTTDLVALLADKGVSLRPMGDTPLAEAMAATKTWGTTLDDLGDIDKLPADLYQQNEIRVSGGEAVDDVHTAYLEAASKELGIQLAGHVAHATTVVLPVIGELHNAIKAAQNLDERCGIRSFKIEMVSGSPLLDVADIVNQIDNFGKITPPREMAFQLDFKPMSDEAIVDLMKIGADAYDTAVAAFVSQAGMELIREVWNVVFCGDKGAYAHYDMFRSDRVKGLSRNFAVFLIATKLLNDSDNLPEVTGLGRLSSNKYTMVLKSLQEVAGSALYTQLMIQRNMEKTGKLIDKVDGKVVYVNKPVFDRFMADGGDIETVLGSVVSGDKKVYVNEIVENVEKFKQAWAYHATQAKLNAASSELLDVRRAIDVFVRQYVRTTEDLVVIANRELIVENCRDYLEGVYAPALKEVDTLAMKVVCEVIFNHTDALQILMGVTEAMVANPDITKEDALNLSMTNYVASWFASQVEIDV
jgi:hypothetical protein